MGSRCGEGGGKKADDELNSQGVVTEAIDRRKCPCRWFDESKQSMFARSFGMAAQAYNENGSPPATGTFHKEIVFNSKTVETPLPKLHKRQDPLWDGYLQRSGTLIRTYTCRAEPIDFKVPRFEFFPFC